MSSIICFALFLSPDLGDDFTMPVDSDGDPGITTEMFLVSENPSDGDTRCINIMIVDDDDYECDQEFLVNFGTLPQLSSLVTSIGSVPVTISDNGGKYITELVCIMTHVL